MLSGDTEAFEALVLEHQNKVYSLALRMVGNEEDARDMAQDVYKRQKEPRLPVDNGDLI